MSKVTENISNNSKPSLFLFTSEFPYGAGEVFIQNELEFLSASFHEIFLLPSKTGKTSSFQLPANVKVIDLDIQNYSFQNKVFLLIRNCLFIFSLLLGEIFRSNQKKMALLKMRNNFYQLFALLIKAERLRTFFNGKKQYCFYTYWFSHEATLMSILKKRKIVPAFISRVHGFDLYENNGKENYIPFRFFQLSNVSAVYCVSKTGMNYLAGLYPVFKEKIKYSYLGVPDHGAGPSAGEELTFVSCSNIVPVKRLDLLLSALSGLKAPAKWVHFGTGYLQPQIESLIKKLPPNIKPELRGQVKNETIMEFYKKNKISAFVNTSISEGLPVSMMEAISFGIPVVATNVGGVSEIVTERTGILLDADPRAVDLCEVLERFRKSEMNTEDFRKNIRKFYLENFSAEVNYRSFVAELLSISNTLN